MQPFGELFVSNHHFILAMPCGFKSRQNMCSWNPCLKLIYTRQLANKPLRFDSTVKFFGDVGEPNLFSLKLLQHVTDRAGVSPVLRIGANTQDRASFCKTCNETVRTISNPDPDDPKQSEALHVTFNEGLFDVITNNVPLGSRIIFGLNFRNGK